MGKIEKKKKKLEERIEMMEKELIASLTKKTSYIAEINVASHQRQIKEMREKLSSM